MRIGTEEQKIMEVKKPPKARIYHKEELKGADKKKTELPGIFYLVREHCSSNVN